MTLYEGPLKLQEAESLALGALLRQETLLFWQVVPQRNSMRG